ncbi:Uncharacterised protein [Vibrio cholerae]|nr:Uncharacterised protein [Vibrio cholerae]
MSHLATLLAVNCSSCNPLSNRGGVVITISG